MIKQQAETLSKQFCSEVRPELGGERFNRTEQYLNDIKQLAPDHCGEVAFTHRCQVISAVPGLRESGLINKDQDEFPAVGTLLSDSNSAWERSNAAISHFSTTHPEVKYSTRIFINISH